MKVQLRLVTPDLRWCVDMSILNIGPGVIVISLHDYSVYGPEARITSLLLKPRILMLLLPRRMSTRGISRNTFVCCKITQ